MEEVGEGKAGCDTSSTALFPSVPHIGRNAEKVILVQGSRAWQLECRHVASDPMTGYIHKKIGALLI